MAKKKCKAAGYMLVEAVLAIITFSLLSMAFMTIFSGQFSQLAAARTASQAQQYAELDASLLRLVNYEYLTDSAVLSEYSLHTGRGSIRSISSPGTWQDEIIIGAERTSSDGQSKYRVGTINIYRNSGDRLPRATLEVPLTASSNTIPVGSVITWPTDGSPTYGGEWLECNGQEVPSKYTTLRKIMTKTPDYRGVFLRGSGSQTFSQNNGSGSSFSPASSRTYSSGSVGQVQGDALLYSAGAITFGGMQWGTGLGGSDAGIFYVQSSGSPSWGSWPKHYPASIGGAGPTTTNWADKNDLWYKALTKYKYTPVIEYDADGKVSNVTLEESEEHPQLEMQNTAIDLFYNFSRMFPTANEIRPINVAVKFFVKAR